MRLLFDENLSHRLVARLAHVYPGSHHVRDLGLESASDRAVAQFAADHGLVVVTKDHDFDDIALLVPAARVLRLDVGNTTTGEIEQVLRRAAPALDAAFAAARLVAVTS